MKNYFPQRLAAFYIDSIVCIIIAYPFFKILFDIEESNIAMPTINYLGIYQGYVMLFYFPIVEALFKTTIGKRIFKLYIDFESKKYHPIFYSIIRTGIRIIPFNIISFLFNDKQLMWHENLSKTKVIKKDKTK